MIFRFLWFLKIWTQITPMLWDAAFNPQAKLVADKNGFSITIKEEE